MYLDLPDYPAHTHLLVGLSGGVDSVVLLHSFLPLATQHGWHLSALHVHHGLSPNADAWADFCAALCAELGVPLRIERVNIAPLRSDHGVEAAARHLRRAAFARFECDVVALAHHADDQAETLLLQLLRGTGVRGASAMSVGRVLTRHETEVGLKPDLRIIRPLLTTSRADILQYARAHQLRWIEDESNQDDHYPRNFLRQHVMPRLAEKFPAYRQTFTRSAQHFAEASQLLDELAQHDAGELHDTLPVTRLQTLSTERAKNLLRYFFDQRGAPMPASSRLQDLLHQLCTARQDAAVCVEYGGWQVRRYQGQVYVLSVLPDFKQDYFLFWQGERELPWSPLNVRLLFEVAEGQLWIRIADDGVHLNLHLPPCVITRVQPITLRLRQGGETLRPHLNAPTRSLKNWLQEHAVPPWLRARLPLVYSGEQLVAVVSEATQDAC